MSVFPTDPIFSKLLISALKPKFLKIKEQIAGIVAMLQVESIFYNSTQKSEKEQAELSKRRLKILDPSSDHLGLLKVMETYKQVKVDQFRKGLKEASTKQFCLDLSVNEK